MWYTEFLICSIWGMGLSAKQLKPVRVECRWCLGDGWHYPGHVTNQRYKLTCAPCEGRGYRDISPFLFDPEVHKIVE